MTQRLKTALIVLQETSGESRVGRRVRETETTSGWGSAWPARTEPTAKYWWVPGRDTAVTSANYLTQTMYSSLVKTDSIISPSSLQMSYHEPRCETTAGPNITTLRVKGFSFHYMLTLWNWTLWREQDMTELKIMIWIYFCILPSWNKSDLETAVCLHNTVKHWPRVWCWNSRWNRVCQKRTVVYRKWKRYLEKSAN